MTKSKRHFSLIELLVAISIITILAGMVIGGLNAVSEKSNIADTRSTVMLLQDALLKYYQDNSGYPEKGSGIHELYSNPSTGTFNQSILKDLQAYGAPVTPDPNSTQIGVYDAWGKPLYIIFPDSYTVNASATDPEAKSYDLNGSTVYYNQRTFQIISAGSDEAFGDPTGSTANKNLEKDNVYNFNAISDN
jgi:prepilin-type N-terminal cleavage/methylation domain-containing protein